MKKLLIIGIESFTGQHLKKYMSNIGFDVYGTSYNETLDKVYQCDITKGNKLKEILEFVLPDYIINLAAISFVATSNKSLFYEVNVLAVENLLDTIVSIENYSPKKIILVSSATVYGNQEENILNESLTPDPINHYGISKLAMEQIAKTYFDKLNIIITRPFNYTGFGQAECFLIPKIVSHFKTNKKEIELGNIEVFREFNDIEFICEAYKRLLEIEQTREIVNIASNRLISLNEVICKMSKIANYKIKVKVNEEFVRKNEILRLSGSSEKLFKLIGEIHQKEFVETLEDMYKGDNGSKN